MQAIDLYEKIENGGCDEMLSSFYGGENLQSRTDRCLDLVNAFMRAYGEEKEAEVFSVPYSVLLAGDGADISIATDRDFLAVVAPTDDKYIRFSAMGYMGTDVIDYGVMGPFSDETGYTASVIRGVCAAYGRRGFPVKGLDIYADCDTLPGAGLEEISHFAVSFAYILNVMYSDGRLSEKQMSDSVQWALANYAQVDSYASDTYSSVAGKSIRGNFRKADSPVIKEMTPDMCGTALYVVSIGDTEVNLPEDEADERIDAFLTELGKEPDEISEKDFYSALCGMPDADKEASLFLMDYYTQENLETIYSKNAHSGTGSPSVSQTVPVQRESCGSKDACEPYSAGWKILCCVSDNAKNEFTEAMTMLYGDDCIETVGFAKHAAMKCEF